MKEQPEISTRTRFPLGDIRIAGSARRKVHARDVETALSRHAQGDWGQVTPEDRGRILGQRSCIIWLTGLSGSGKSTLARELESRLTRQRRL